MAVPRLLRTVRARITLAAAVAVTVVLGGASLALVANQRAQLTQALDDNLVQRLDELASDLQGGRPAPETFGGTNPEDRLIQLVGSSGEVLVATDNMVGEAPVVTLPDSGEAFTTVDGLPIEDDTFRVLARRLGRGSGSPVLIVAENTDDLEDSVRTLGTSLAATVPVAVLVLVAVVWWLVGRTLRPVEDIRRRTAAIGSADLDQRAPEPGTGDEVDRLAVTVNAMLDRLEAGAEREHRFVADTSHELRTPLTRMHTTLEVDGDPADPLWASILEEVVGLERLVDDLLVLARRDSGVAPRREPVDLDDLVVEEARRIRVEGRGEVDLRGVTGAQLVGDPDELRRVVRNLLDNAARHAARHVAVACREERGGVVLEVADDGPGIDAADRERIFERFARLDEARGGDSGGTGLGLAIVAAITRAHGGTVTVDDTPGGGARFTVRLPAS